VSVEQHGQTEIGRGTQGGSMNDGERYASRVFIFASRFAGKRYTFPGRSVLRLNQRPLPYEGSEGFSHTF
jgi:hypothetical protein